MMNTNPYHIDKLKKEFHKRSSENPRYSMRAFAKRLDIHPSALCRILSLKQKLSCEAALVTVEKLELSREEKRLFLQSVVETRQAEQAREIGNKINIPDLRIMPEEFDTQACAEVFNLTAHSILMLTFSEDFQSDNDWIAQRLRKPVEEVSRTIEALLKLGLLKNADGRLTNAAQHFSAVKCEQIETVRRDHQKAILERAVDSLVNDPIEQRAHYAVTLTIDPEKLPKAREMILKFLENLDDFLESGKRKQVYQAAVQLFPLDYPIQN